jgi:hypothetical protein
MGEPALPPVPFTPESLAERWGCSADQVRALCRRGRLDHFTIGKGMYRIPQAAAVAFEEAGLAAAQPAPTTLRSVGPEDESRGGHEAPGGPGPTVPGTGRKRGRA